MADCPKTDHRSRSRVRWARTREVVFQSRMCGRMKKKPASQRAKKRRAVCILLLRAQGTVSGAVPALQNGAQLAEDHGGVAVCHEPAELFHFGVDRGLIRVKPADRQIN